MNLRKRTLALLLTLCLLLSVAVPMVSAADLYLKVQIGTKGAANYEYIANPSEVETSNNTGYEQIKFMQSDANAGSWVAIRIKDSSVFAAGEYHLSLQFSKINNVEEKGGKADVYLLADTNKTGAELNSYITAGMTDSNFVGLMSSVESEAGLKDNGVVTVGESFILVIKSAAGQTAQDGNSCWVRLASVNFVPIQTAADANELDSALFAIGSSAGGRPSTVRLTADFTAGDVTIPKNVTLDLNGHTLTVTSITNEGKQTGEGSIVTAPDAPAPSTPAPSTPDPSTPDASTPDASTPDASTPDASTPAPSTPGAADSDPASPVLYIVLAVAAAAVIAAVAIVLIRKKKNS